MPLTRILHYIPQSTEGMVSEQSELVFIVSPRRKLGTYRRVCCVFIDSL